MTFTTEDFIKKLATKNPNQPEFIQAVSEVVESLEGYLNQHPEYLNQAVLERLTEPDRIVSFRVSWVDDAGKIRVNRGYRVQFNNALGPYKGGLRFHPTVNLSVLKFLGFEQIFKNSLTGLPLGGGKGGSDFDPKGCSDGEIMRFCQSFMTELYRHIGPDTDVPAGDINVGAREIGYLFGQYKRLVNQYNGALTGKGVGWGGSLIRTEATGYGVVYMLEQVLLEQKQTLKGKTVLVSGSGNVAQHTVEKLLQLGAKPLTMSDSAGTIYAPEGISKEQLEFIKELKNQRRGRIKEAAEKFDWQYLEGQKPWQIAADIAIPCATQNEIELADAQQLVKNQVKIVIEGANMPSTAEAMALLRQKTTFVPAKAANAGGVAVSGLEMSQNSGRVYWTAEEVDRQLKQIMIKIHQQMLEYGQGDYVKGANIAGFKQVADAVIAQGVV